MKLTNKNKWLLTVASSVALFASPAFAANIAGNGGFEVAGVGGPLDSDLWTETAAGGVGTQSVRGGPPASGLWAHELTVVGTTGIGSVAVITQNSLTDSGLASLQENTSLSASFDYQGIFGPGVVAFATLRVLNSSGAIVATSGLQGPLAPSASFTNYSFPAALNVPAFGAAPNDSYAAFLEISVNGGAFVGSDGTMIVDNVVINGTLIPEPNSLALLAFGGLAAFVRRRSRS